MKIKLASACTILLACTLPAPAAQAGTTYCCADGKGSQICSDILPPACFGRAYREINERGLVKRVDAPPTAEQRARQEAELKKAKADQQNRLEQERKNRALLATYTSETDIDYMRDRTVAELERAMKHSQNKYEEAAKRQKKLNDEAEFHKKKGLPPQLNTAVRDNENEMKAQQAAVEAKQKEIEAVRARYDEEKSRYREITAARKPADSR